MRFDQPFTVLTYGAKVLRQKAKPVTSFEGIPELGERMLDQMRRSHGVGLAAPQVGIGLQVLVADGSDFDATLKAVVLVNPQILEKEGEDLGLEGCLSLPGIEVEVKRAREIRVKAYAPDGTPLDFKAKHFFARIIQHEMDHLNGVLLLDYLPSLERILAIWKLKKKKGLTDSERVRDKKRAVLV